MEYLKVKAVANRLGISERAVQLRCKMYKVQKVKGRYAMTEPIVSAWEQSINEGRNEATTEAKQRVLSEPEPTHKQLDLEDIIQAVKAETNPEPEYPEGSEILMPDEVLALRERLQNEKLLEVEVKLLRERIEDFQNQVQYLRGSLDKQNNQFQKLIESIQQSNFITAKREGLDKT